MSDELPPPPSTPETKPPCRHLFKRISTWYDWEGAENEQWYFKGSCSDRWFGSRWFHTSAAIFFFVLGVVLPLVVLSFSGSAQTAIDTVSRHFLISFIWLATTTLALPLFIWCERLAFDDWVGKIDDRKQKKKLTARFELNSKHMEVFWKTVAGIYAAAGLFTLAQKAESTKNPMQDDIKALTAALNRIADVESRKTRSDDARNSDNQKSASGEIKKTSLDEAGVTDSGRTNEVQAPPATPPSGNKTKP